MQHPKRIETVHTETLDGELCLYDWQRMEVHNLNPTAARVWELCDGGTTPQQIAAQLHGDLTPAQAEELVWLSLKRLEKANLLAADVVKPAGRAILTRREMLKGLGVAAVMLPVVTSIVAPSPVAAQSDSGGGCITRSTVATDITSSNNIFGAYYAFPTPITAAEIAACGITQISLSWTGDAPTGGSGYVVLAQSLAAYASGSVQVPVGTASPVTSATSSCWTGNEPYNGVIVGTGNTNWTVGQITITLS